MTRWEVTPGLPWEAYERANVLILRARMTVAGLAALVAGLAALLAWLVSP